MLHFVQIKPNYRQVFNGIVTNRQASWSNSIQEDVKNPFCAVKGTLLKETFLFCCHFHFPLISTTLHNLWALFLLMLTYLNFFLFFHSAAPNAEKVFFNSHTCVLDSVLSCLFLNNLTLFSHPSSVLLISVHVIKVLNKILSRDV